MEPSQFNNLDVKELIADLRGGYPKTCDFCLKERTEDELVPDEAGEWSCIYCWDRWENEEINKI